MIMSNMMSSEAIGHRACSSIRASSSGSETPAARPIVTVSWYKTGVTSIEQVKTQQLIVGAPGGTAGVIYVTAMNGLIGTKFKLVTGYPGGNEVNLAMERGEIDGRASNSWASWKSTHPDWVKDKKIIVLVQIGLKRAPILADVPALVRARPQRHGPAGPDLPVRRYRHRAFAGRHPGHAAGARRSAAARLRRHHAGSGFHRRSRDGAAGCRPHAWRGGQKIADSIVNTPPEVVARAKALLGDLLK